jgi:UDP-apiose/xylose synthase
LTIINNDRLDTLALAKLKTLAAQQREAALAALAGQRILAIGCGGYVGSHLLDALLERSDIEVEGWDPDAAKIERHTHKPNFRFRNHGTDSTASLTLINEAVKRADIVVNLAALCNPSEYNTRPLTTIQSNFIDCLPIVGACARYGRWLVHFSTSEVYGRTLASYTANDDYEELDLFEQREATTPLVMGPITNQRWTYAASKQLLERLVYAQHKETGMPFTIIRPFNFFGPRMDYIPGRDGEGVPRVLACFMAALLDGTPMQLVDGGIARRTIVSIDDAMRAILQIMARPDQACNRFFNIGHPGNELTMRQLAELMRSCYVELTGLTDAIEHPIVDISAQEFYGEGYEDCDRRMPDINDARRLLEWEPLDDARATVIAAMSYYIDQAR